MLGLWVLGSGRWKSPPSLWLALCTHSPFIYMLPYMVHGPSVYMVPPLQIQGPSVHTVPPDTWSLQIHGPSVQVVPHLRLQPRQNEGYHKYLLLMNASTGNTASPHLSSVQFSCSVMSDSLRPHELQHARPPCPSPSPGVHSDSCPSSQ